MPANKITPAPALAIINAVPKSGWTAVSAAGMAINMAQINNAIFLDVHILVASRLSVSEGHFIGEQVRLQLLHEVPNIKDITVHVDSEDDEIAEQSEPSDELLQRDKIIQLLQNRWQNLINEINDNNIILHYLSGKIYVEVRLPLALLIDNKHAVELAAELREKVSDITDIAKVDLLFY